MTRISLALLVPFLVPHAAAAGISITSSGGAFQVSGWKPSVEPTSGWNSVFSVYVGTGDVPAMLGSYAVEGGVLTFRPRWPIAPGMHVRALFHVPGEPPVEAAFD